MGCPMSVAHNEVAPGQHEMSPIYCIANASADYNVLFMEVANREAAKEGLAILFHEKPFAGINGSGKHSNWYGCFYGFDYVVDTFVVRTCDGIVICSPVN